MRWYEAPKERFLSEYDDGRVSLVTLAPQLFAATVQSGTVARVEFHQLTRHTHEDGCEVSLCAIPPGQARLASTQGLIGELDSSAPSV